MITKSIIIILDIPLETIGDKNSNIIKIIEIIASINSVIFQCLEFNNIYDLYFKLNV